MKIDYLLVQKGKVRICVYDGNKNSETYGKLVEIEVNGKPTEVIDSYKNYMQLPKE